MNVNFHIDQINEVLKYLDEIPHKFSRGLIDFIKNHVDPQIKAGEQEVKNVVTDIKDELNAIKEDLSK